MILVDHYRATAASDTNLLATATIEGRRQIIEKLLDARAHPSQQEHDGWTPLQLARQYGHTDTANLLARRGAAVGSRPSRWVTEKQGIKVSDDGCQIQVVGKYQLRSSSPSSHWLMSLAQPSPRIIITLAYLPSIQSPLESSASTSKSTSLKDVLQYPSPLVLPRPTSCLIPQQKNLV